MESGLKREERKIPRSWVEVLLMERTKKGRENECQKRTRVNISLANARFLVGLVLLQSRGGSIPEISLAV